MNEKVRRAKDYLNEADWFDYLPNHPANEPDDDYKQGYRPKSFPYKILAILVNLLSLKKMENYTILTMMV